MVVMPDSVEKVLFCLWEKNLQVTQEASLRFHLLNSAKISRYASLNSRYCPGRANGSSRGPGGGQGSNMP